MTICIAAIARHKEDEIVVFACDHMVTTGMGQFEHGMDKYKCLGKTAVALLAGNPLYFDELVALESSNADFEAIRTRIYENFRRKRREIVEREIFDRYGIDQSFFLQCLKGQIPNAHIDTILRQVAQFRLKTTILLIGIDKGAAKIVEIDEENTASFTDMHFHAIGSGTTQAANTLLFQRHSRSDGLLCALYNVYKAKRNAEVAQGVGRETELFVLTKDGHRRISERNLNTLSGIYEEERTFGNHHKDLSRIELQGEQACS